MPATAMMHVLWGSQSAHLPLIAMCCSELLGDAVVNATCRDVKLENIFLTSRNLMKLGDFGLALSLKQEMPISPVGTVEYMAPEVHRHGRSCALKMLLENDLHGCICIS